MKEFFKPTKFKLIAGVLIFVFSFISGYFFYEVGLGNSFFKIMLQPVIWLRDGIGETFNVGHRTVCPTLPPCFEIYPHWVTVVSIIAVLYLYSAVLELFYRVVKKKNQ